MIFLLLSLQGLQLLSLLSEVLLLLCLDQSFQKFINKTLKRGKRLLVNSDPWSPAEQKLEMLCDMHSLIFTARIRSLGQGNIFTPVCHSVHRGVWSGPGGCLGGTCSRGMPSPEGGCLLPGGAWWRPPGKLLLQAVRILLECI